ncbi:MAG: hypothetical protein LUC91_04540 [Prevotella sp.]|nr:hypothetical protein [Prevotella sp.]
MNGKNKKILLGMLLMVLPLVCLLFSSCFNDEFDDVSTASIASDRALICFQITTGEMGDLNATRADGDGQSGGTGSQGGGTGNQGNGNSNAPGGDNYGGAGDVNEGQVEQHEGGNSDAQQYAVAGEYINTLCIFVLNAEDSVIQAKIEPDLTGTAAAKGNLPTYTSEAFEVPAGEKIFYAFANWDNAESDEWLSLIDKEVGETILPSDVDFEVEAVQHVDIANGKYIPMSVIMTGVTVTGNDLNFTREIQLRLDRLVAKVEMQIDGDTSKDLEIGELLFSGTAKTVPLISLSSTGGATSTLPDSYFDNDSHVVFSNQIIPKDSFLVDTFYINESYRGYMESGGSGFGITLDLVKTGENDEYDGTEYTAITPRLNIQRNSVYPIELTLNKYITKFSVTAKTVPIGGQEVSYTTDADWDDITNSFIVTLRDVTTSFTISPTLYSVSTDDNGNETQTSVSGVTWTLTNSDGSEASINNLTVSGLTATPGYSYEFNLTASWSSSSGDNSAGTSNTVTHTRTYKLKVVFAEGEIYIGSENGSYQISPQQWRQVLLPDRLNMTLKRKID